MILVSGSGANSIEMSVQAPDGGWLVLADAWYPGWEASVDGEGVQIYIANVLFRAVWVPPGEHAVAFEYRPVSFYAGSALSLLGWSLALILWWRWRDEM